MIKRSICSRQCATAHSTNLLDTHGELPRASTCKDKKWPKVVQVAFEGEGPSSIFESRRERTEGSTKFGRPTRPRPPCNDVNRRPLSGHLISASRTIKRRLILRSHVLSVMETLSPRAAYLGDAIARENLYISGITICGNLALRKLVRPVIPDWND